MAPILVHVWCGNGSASKGFQDAGFHVKAGIDDDAVAVLAFRTMFPHALTRHVNEVDTIMNHIGSVDVLLLTPTHFHSLRKGAAVYFSVDWVRKLKPRVVVMIAPSQGSEGQWVQMYLQGMQNTFYDSMITTLNTNDFNCAIEADKTVCISVCTTSLVQDPREVFAQVAGNIKNKQVVPRTYPRHALSRMRWGGNYKGVWLYPRTKRQQAVFSLDKPLPPLRSTCSSPPPVGYERKSNDFCGLSESITLNLKDIRELAGLPPMFDIENQLFLSRSVAVSLLTRSLPVFFSRSIAEAVFAIPVLDLPQFLRRKVGVVVPVSVSRTSEKLSVGAATYETRSSPVLKAHPGKRKMTRVERMQMCSMEDVILDSFKDRVRALYTIGSGNADDCVSAIVGVSLPVDWTVEIRERKDKKHANDDMVVRNPTGSKFYSLTKIREHVKNNMSSQ